MYSKQAFATCVLAKSMKFSMDTWKLITAVVVVAWLIAALMLGLLVALKADEDEINDCAFELLI